MLLLLELIMSFDEDNELSRSALKSLPGALLLGDNVVDDEDVVDWLVELVGIGDVVDWLGF